MSAVIEAELISSPSIALTAPLDNLTTKQTLFVQHFIETRNGVKSAQFAGYKGNYDTLRVVAAENLAKPYIRQALEDHFASLCIGSNETLAELSQIARFDVISNPEGPIKPSDKLKALDLAGKFYKLWDKPAEDSPTNQAAGELLNMLKGLMERARQAQAQLPASVSEQSE